MNSSFCNQAEDSLGPQISRACRVVDFTSLFEESFFSIAPSSIFLTLAVLRTCLISTRHSIADSGWLHLSKLSSIGLLAIGEIVQLILSATSTAKKTRTNVPSNALATIAAVLMLILSHFEHRKTFRPSSTLCTYLFVSLLLDIPQARTKWMSDQPSSITDIFSAMIGLKIMVLFLESQVKIGLLSSSEQNRSPEETGNVFSRRLFWWLNTLFYRGYNKILLLPDLFTIDEDLSSEILGARLERQWVSRKDIDGKFTLIWCLIKTFKWPLLLPVIPRLFYSAFIFAQPFLIGITTGFVDTPSAPDYYGYGLIGAYALVYGGIALSSGWYWHKQYRLITMFRGALVSVIYSKSLRLSATAANGSQATTLMSADVEIISTGLTNLHELWGASVDLGIGLWLLYRQVGLAMLSLAAMTLACAFGASKTAHYAAVRQKKWMESMQERMSETIEMLANLKSIKMLGLESRLQISVQELRVKEVQACVHYRRATTIVIILAHANLFVNTVIVFAAFLPLSKRPAYQLSTERIFDTLALIGLVSSPLQKLIQSLPQLAMTVGCITRIQGYLTSPDHVDPRVYFSESETGDQEKSANFNEFKELNASYLIRNGKFRWSLDSPAVLNNVNLHVPLGGLTMLVGPVGSGKTTLLHALLGECLQVGGQTICIKQEVAFCAQQPWLTNTSVRNAITKHSLVEESWYQRVVRACALEQDIESLEQGDGTSIGSGGGALSGGQKQRVALARAIYARRSAVFLDDIFSGLDRSTETAVFDGLFGRDGIFRTSLPNTTVVLATHAVRYLKNADHIIVLSADFHAHQGTLGELQARGTLIEELKGREDKHRTTDSDSITGEARVKPIERYAISQPAADIAPVNDKHILGYYISAMGFWNVTMFLTLAILTIGLWKMSDYWARIWGESSDQHPFTTNHSMFVGIYALFNILALIAASLWYSHYLLVVIPKTGMGFHGRILKTVLHSTYPFLSRTDSGTLAARFGQDLLLVDTELPRAFTNTIFATLVLTAQLALIATASMYMMAAFPVLFGALYLVQRIFLRTSKRIRHLDLEAKSPLYAQFTDTLEGITSLRAFGWQTSLKDQNDLLLNDSQRPFYLLFCVQRWLECVLDLTVGGLAVVFMGIVVATRHGVGGAQIGVALLNLVTIGENMKDLVQSWTMLETTIATVSRIRNFTQASPQEIEPAENGVDGEDHMKSVQELTSQEILTLTNVSASYSADAPNVLSSLSLKVSRGEKIAICGRSGSGKSSFLNVLLRMMAVTAGEVTIFGKPSTSYRNEQLRQLLNTVPQSPYFYPGTFKENLDPESAHSDEQIIHQLRKVDLGDKITEHGGLLGRLIPRKFSFGQLQLLALVRALLRPSGLILLDEATSNVDNETDKMMHDIIFEDFEEQTVIAILHRQDQLHRFNRVVFIDKGQILRIEER